MKVSSAELSKQSPSQRGEFLPTLSFHLRQASPFGSQTLRLEIGGVRVVLGNLSHEQARSIQARHGIFCSPATSAASDADAPHQGDAALAIRVSDAHREGFLLARPRGDQPEYYRVELHWEESALIATSYEWSGWFALTRREGGLALSQSAVSDPRAFDRSLENYLRVLYSHLIVKEGGLLLHSAGLVRDGQAYLFFGPSGAGKTTVSIMSPGATVLSDDLTLITRGAQEATARYAACSVPFRGLFAAQPDSANEYPLAGLFRLVQDRSDFVVPIQGAVAAGEVLASLPFVMERPEMAHDAMTAVSELVKKVPVFRLHFQKDPAFWKVVETAVDGFRKSGGIRA